MVKGTSRLPVCRGVNFTRTETLHLHTYGFPSTVAGSAAASWGNRRRDFWLDVCRDDQRSSTHGAVALAHIYGCERKHLGPLHLQAFGAPHLHTYCFPSTVAGSAAASWGNRRRDFWLDVRRDDQHGAVALAHIYGCER